MTDPKKLRVAIAVSLLGFATVVCALEAEVDAGSNLLTEGAVLDLGGRKATLRRLDALPLVESDYSKRFRFDSHENPKLKELRERYHLDAVIASGPDELSKQVLLNHWVHQQFKNFGHPSAEVRGALEILEAIDKDHAFFCKQYAELLVSAASSLGWIDRPLALRRHQGVAKIGGSTEHSVTEIWSNQYRKWVMLDPTLNMYLEKNDVPLNAFEIRQEWFYHEGKDLVFVVSKDRRKYRKPDLPVFLQHFAGHGDLAIHPDELDKYGFIGYIPNTDLMDSGFDYGKMFIAKDKLCDGTQWHKRTVPSNPALDPYFPIGQAALSLQPHGGNVSVAVKTLTPNFARCEARFNGGAWKPAADAFVWTIQSGLNRMEIRTVNEFGVTGSISTAELELSK